MQRNLFFLDCAPVLGSIPVFSYITIIIPIPQYGITKFAYQNNNLIEGAICVLMSVTVDLTLQYAKKSKFTDRSNIVVV